MWSPKFISADGMWVLLTPEGASALVIIAWLRPCILE